MEEKISIEGIDHISISVRDMDAAIRFYMNLMYAKLIKKVKMTDCLVAYLELGCGVLLELVENGNRVSCKRVSGGYGYRHVAFRSNTLGQWEKHFKEHGIELVLPLTHIKELAMDVMLIKDPDGTVLEFCNMA